jgi:hypothetical protein
MDDCRLAIDNIGFTNERLPPISTLTSLHPLSTSHYLLPYSYRSATMGSTFAARRAGTKLASSTTAANISETAMNIEGSVGFTPYSKLDKKRLRASAPNESDADPDGRKKRTLGYHHEEHAPSLGAQRYANANFLRAPRDVEAEYTIDPHRSQRQCHGGEYPHEQRVKRRM